MTVLKQYNPSTSQWETVVVGKQGPAGFVSQATAPTNTNLLWLDTTGTSSTNALSPTIIDAKGDLIVGTADNSVARLAVGATNGQVLTVDSAQSTGLTWATPTQIFPRHISINPYSPSAVSNASGLWALTTSSGELWYVAGSGSTTGGYLEWPILMDSGTWDFAFILSYGSNRGIITVSINGSSVGTIDMYAAATNPTLTKLSAVSVASAGMKTLRVEITGKNASSTAYNALVGPIGLTRTGA